MEDPRANGGIPQPHHDVVESLFAIALEDEAPSGADDEAWDSRQTVRVSRHRDTVESEAVQRRVRQIVQS